MPQMSRRPVNGEHLATGVGINACDAVRRDGEFVWHAVNVAARLASPEEQRQVLVTGIVKAAIDHAGPASGIGFEAPGEQCRRNCAPHVHRSSSSCGERRLATNVAMGGRSNQHRRRYYFTERCACIDGWSEQR